jgi:hypothetical protein
MKLFLGFGKRSPHLVRFEGWPRKPARLFGSAQAPLAEPDQFRDSVAHIVHQKYARCIRPISDVHVDVVQKVAHLAQIYAQPIECCFECHDFIS